MDIEPTYSYLPNNTGDYIVTAMTLNNAGSIFMAGQYIKTKDVFVAGYNYNNGKIDKKWSIATENNEIQEALIYNITSDKDENVYVIGNISGDTEVEA